MITEKECTKCKRIKPASDFYKEKRYTTGLTSQCKKCIYDGQLNYRDKNYFMTTHHNKSSECRRKSLPYDLDPEYLESIWPTYCPVFGIELTPRKDRHVDSTPHLDRLDPEKGYVKGNVRFISRKANLIKSNATWKDIARVAIWLRKQTTDRP